MRENIVPKEELSYFLLKSPFFIDVRSEIEYERGHFPNSINIPLLTTWEREQVGKCYHKQGQKEAIALGERLVSGEVKEERVRKWLEVVKTHSITAFYCARGGLRSEIAQQWLKERGEEVLRVEGGYKSLRRFALEVLDKICCEFYVITGKTGAGKTELLGYLQPFCPVIDLENLAEHRGSAFGAKALSQPAQSTFENSLALKLFILSCRFKSSVIFLEDESRFIGKLKIPDNFFKKISFAKRIYLKASLEERVKRIANEYVISPLRGKVLSKEELERKLLESTYRLKPSLGKERTNTIKEKLQFAFNSANFFLPNIHYPWIRDLLIYYYDPLYEKHLKKVKDLIIFSGEQKEVEEFCLNISNSFIKNPIINHR